MNNLVFEGIAFLVAAVLAPTLFKRLGFGTAVGYLFAGILIGPYGLRVFRDAESVMDVAQLGVVLLLFVIGLDTRLSRLVAMKRDILFVGNGQVWLTALVLGFVAWLFGLSIAAVIIVGFAFALSGTAIALQLLDERGDMSRPYGQKSFAVLLTQDMLTVPILALIPLFLVGTGTVSRTGSAIGDTLLAIGVVGGIILVGRYVLDHVFRWLATGGAREVMTAAALLVVIFASLAASYAGLSMALGAFLAGVMLAGSSYRHQLRADVEPFRGLLLALFFMSIGMLINLADVWNNILLVVTLLVAYLVIKVTVATLVAHFSGSSWPESLRFGLLLSAAGEFAFVLVPLVAGQGLIDAQTTNILIALAALSMVASPPLAVLAERWIKTLDQREETPEEDFGNARGSALVIGFGRFGQIASQLLLAEDIETTLIDFRPERIRAAARFGFKVYYGHGLNLDMLRAAGAEQAKLIMVCIDDPTEALAAVTMIRSAFPEVQLHARAYDRGHALALMKAGVDHQVRETFESAITAGRGMLEALGVPHEQARRTEHDVRQRDLKRLELQRLQGVDAGVDFLHSNLQPEPLKAPDHPATSLNTEADEILHQQPGEMPSKPDEFSE
ncbi:cation:proton antiporter [Saccharospirillum sp.]|uniref:cation:proton antiporter domain-containing protein n=1 Tax=Saccharospirillum sp. TaxID=2033801 RepID=UPI0034A0553D